MFNLRAWRGLEGSRQGGPIQGIWRPGSDGAEPERVRRDAAGLPGVQASRGRRRSAEQRPTGPSTRQGGTAARPGRRAPTAHDAAARGRSGACGGAGDAGRGRARRLAGPRGPPTGPGLRLRCSPGAAAGGGRAAAAAA